MDGWMDGWVDGWVDLSIQVLRERTPQRSYNPTLSPYLPSSRTLRPQQILEHHERIWIRLRVDTFNSCRTIIQDFLITAFLCLNVIFMGFELQFSGSVTGVQTPGGERVVYGFRVRV